ncbi:MAG: paraquat-inducible protein A [Phycisphaeraceae bacterium]|nr:paraquat-inducible protein A [Phycisphaeraceae bacterium]
MAQSLHQHFPGRLHLPVLTGCNIVLLIIALNLPFMTVDKLVFFEEDYSLLRSIRSMWDSKHYVLAVIIFTFSIVFPFAKLGALLLIWFKSITPENRQKSLSWLGILGKWSMLDVFVIAILIVLTQSKGFVEATAEIGVYVFAAAILMSLVLSLWIEHVARSVDKQADA